MPIKIAIADDKASNRQILQDKLRRHGHFSIVLTAVDGSDFLEKMYQLPAGELPDVVLMDLEMPNMDGISLTRYLRDSKDYQELPLILVTSLENPEDRERGMIAGANAYIVKRGFNQAELLSRIQQLL